MVHVYAHFFRFDSPPMIRPTMPTGRVRLILWWDLGKGRYARYLALSFTKQQNVLPDRILSTREGVR